jgi:hypothetical protein
MKKENRLSREVALYSLIFLLALASRLVRLGQTPLLETEASWALQAWQLAQGVTIPIGSQVSYLSITEGLFSLFAPSEFLARFWPALVGSTLVWLPFLLRKEIGRVPALVLAGGLAMDPALVPVSRLAGSPMPALVFIALAFGAFHLKMVPWALLFFGMGLFSGPGFWTGILILGLAIWICTWRGLISPGNYIKDRLGYFEEKSENLLVGLSPALLGLFIIGTFFLSNFQGLSAWAGSFQIFIMSWANQTGLGIGKFLIYLALNNPLILVFGILGFISAWRAGDNRGKLLSIWFMVSLLFLLIYPHRQAVDLIWLVLPLWIATALEVVRLFRLAAGGWVTWSLAGLVVTLASLNWLTFTGMIFQAWNQKALLLELGLLAASLALLILASTIIASEWSWRTSWKGLSVGGVTVLLLFMVASLSLDGYLVEKDPRSIFSGGTGTGQMDLLRESIADASITATGRPDSIQGAVIGSGDALQWALREYEEFDYLVRPPSGMNYPILITTEEGAIQEIQDNYRGQDFVLSGSPNWGRVLPDDWISWIAFRKGPVNNKYLVLWVRNDINSGY